MKRFPIQSSIESDLESILGELDSRLWTIQELFDVLRGKGYPFLIILLSLPFCQPIQIPGFSTPFGLVLVFIGLRMTFGHRIWWPQWILKKQIPTQVLKIVVQKSLSFFRFLRPLLHPRLTWLCENGFYRFHGGFVVLMSGLLALPLPIPFSNMLVAWALLLLGLGLIEKDGGFVCISYTLGLTGLFLLIFLIDWLHAWAVS